LTYRELNGRTNQLAHHLQKLGVGTGAMVGVCLERSLELIVALLGILKAGGAYVSFDPAHPQERLKSMLADLQAPVLVTQEKFRGQFAFEISNPDLKIKNPVLVCLDKDRSRSLRKLWPIPRAGRTRQARPM